MSLIRARRERKEMSGSGIKTPPAARKLVLVLIIVAVLIWWMGQLGG